MFKNKMLLLALIFPLSAVAEQNIESWDDVVRELGKKGVSANAVNWLKINEYCQSESEAEQNNCKYKSAVLQVTHANDTNYCRSKADIDYFNFRKPNCEVVVDSASQPMLMPVKSVEKASYIDAAYVKCMGDLGWISSSNWALGKRE